MFFNDAINTFYLRLYGVRHMVKNHSDSERGNPLPRYMCHAFRLDRERVYQLYNRCVIAPNQIPLTTIVTYLQKSYRSRISNHWVTIGVIAPNQIPLTTIVTYLQKSYRSRISNHWVTIGVIAPNQIPLTTIVTYLQKSYRSRISNHWATIPACSVVPPIYNKYKKTYCHISF